MPFITCSFACFNCKLIDFYSFRIIRHVLLLFLDLIQVVLTAGVAESVDSLQSFLSSCGYLFLTSAMTLTISVFGGLDNGMHLVKASTGALSQRDMQTASSLTAPSQNTLSLSTAFKLAHIALHACIKVKTGPAMPYLACRTPATPTQAMEQKNKTSHVATQQKHSTRLQQQAQLSRLPTT